MTWFYPSPGLRGLLHSLATLRGFLLKKGLKQVGIHTCKRDTWHMTRSQNKIGASPQEVEEFLKVIKWNILRSHTLVFMNHLTKCHQAWLVSQRGCLIAHDMDDRQPSSCTINWKSTTSTNNKRDPCSTTLFRWTRIWIKIEVCYRIPGGILNTVEPYIPIPHLENREPCSRSKHNNVSGKSNE